MNPPPDITPPPPPAPGKRPFPWLNLLLFALTVLTCLLGGAVQVGRLPFWPPADLWAALRADPWAPLSGLPFAAALLGILLAHEMGHFLVARRHGVDASLPYFIPVPSFIGTFGAVIRMRSPVTTRSALVEIGAAGPLAGLCVAIPVLIVGYSLSSVIVVRPDAAVGIQLGDSLLLWAIERLIVGTHPVGTEVLLHPVAFAGWVGCLVTMLNLLPSGQLDGGHIVFAFAGRHHRAISLGAVLLVVILGATTTSINWFVWAAILLLVGPGHPRVLEPQVPLGARQRAIAIAALVALALTFMPSPLPL